MRFYVEFKRPELGDDQLWEYEDSQIVPWTDEYKRLLQLNIAYRDWSASASEEDVEKGAVPESIVEGLKSILKICALLENVDDCHFDTSTGTDALDNEEDVFLFQQMKARNGLKTKGYLDLYPGLEGKTYRSSDVSIAVVSFNREVDLTAVAAHPDGLTKETLFKLLPTIKWMSGYLDLPIVMTPEQLEVEDNNPYTPWWYIARDTYFYLAGIEMNVFMGGSKSFNREK